MPAFINVRHRATLLPRMVALGPAARRRVPGSTALVGRGAPDQVRWRGSRVPGTVHRRRGVPARGALGRKPRHPQGAPGAVSTPGVAGCDWGRVGMPRARAAGAALPWATCNHAQSAASSTRARRAFGGGACWARGMIEPPTRLGQGGGHLPAGSITKGDSACAAFNRIRPELPFPAGAAGRPGGGAWPQPAHPAPG